MSRLLFNELEARLSRVHTILTELLLNEQCLPTDASDLADEAEELTNPVGKLGEGFGCFEVAQLGVAHDLQISLCHARAGQKQPIRTHKVRRNPFE